MAEMSKISLLPDDRPGAGGGRASGCGDQLADVEVARGDHAVEGRHDLLEGLQLFQPAHIGLRGVDLVFVAFKLRDGVVRVLLRDCVLADQALVAIGGYLGQCRVALRGRQVGLGLGELLIQLRRLDDREQFAFVHVRADVVVPGFDVASGSRVDRRQSEGLHVARQHDLLRALLQDGLRQRRRAERQRASVYFASSALACWRRTMPATASNDRHDEDDDDRRQ